MANSVKVALFLCVLVPVFAAERTTISGKVLDAAGTPLKDATVLIYKAGVKTGYSTYCPTCYVDCGKHTVTGSDGGFKLDGLSPDLLLHYWCFMTERLPQQWIRWTRRKAPWRLSV